MKFISKKTVGSKIDWYKEVKIRGNKKPGVFYFWIEQETDVVNRFKTGSKNENRTLKKCEPWIGSDFSNGSQPRLKYIWTKLTH